MAKRKATRPTWHWVLLGTVLLVGLGLGLLATFMAGANHGLGQRQIASGAQLDADRAAITKQYLAASSTACTDPSDPVKPADRVAVFYKYLRVNAYADRAVIRGCNNHDTLLAKINGTWQATEVNMNLDASANPVWQSACDITDITRADTKIRPENSSIDAGNLKMCQALQQDKILTVQDL